MRKPFVASLVLLACLAANSPGFADLREVQKRGTLRVLAVLSPDEAYFFSPSSDSARPGFDHEVLQSFSNLHKLKVEVVPVQSWDDLIPALAKGKGDVIAGGFTDTEPRRKLIGFTVEVFPTRIVVISRKPHRVVKTVEELRAEKVGTIRGTMFVDAIVAAGVPASNLDDSLATGTVPEALRSGRITAGVDGLEAGLTAKAKDPELQIGLFLGRPESLAYGIRKEDAQLLKALNEYLGNLRRTPTWSRLAVKYFGEAAPEILKKARTE